MHVAGPGMHVAATSAKAVLLSMPLQDAKQNLAVFLWPMSSMLGGHGDNSRLGFTQSKSFWSGL